MVNQRKVLLIDDEQIMHDLASAYLERVGYILISAYSGTSGLRMIAEEKPDIVLLDYLLPGMDGEKVFAELRRNPHYRDVRDTPVIFLTARGSDDSLKARLMRRGITAYLQKPFGLRELSDIINNIILMTDIRRSNRLLERAVRSTRQNLSILVQNAPIGIFSTNSAGDIAHANEKIHNLLHHFVDFNSQINVFQQEVIGKTFFAEGVNHVLETGSSWRRESIRWETAERRNLVLNAHFVPISLPEAGFTQTEGVMGIVEDVTERERKSFQMKLLSHIAFKMQETMEIEKMLHLLLTSITAGQALGFTRAMIFLCDEHGEYLKGAMGVGPLSADEAGEIWHRLENENLTFEQFLDKYGPVLPGTDDRLNNEVKHIKIQLHPDSDLLRYVLEKKPFRCKVGEETNWGNTFPPELRRLQMDEFIAMPIIASDRLLGIILADNKFGKQPILDDRVQMLSTIASQAAHGLEKANAYKQLQEEKEKLEKALRKLREIQARVIRSERLAAIGEMAAHVAHEIRNPLVTIGGFARQIHRENPKSEGTVYPEKIIVDEVLRLEKILANVLNFTKLPEPEMAKCNLNSLVAEVAEQIRPAFENSGVAVLLQLHENMPDSLFDASQIRQVLINLLHNSAQAQEQNGTIKVKTSVVGDMIEIVVVDEGTGIKPEYLPEIFNPFYTTKKHGTGLGLAISQQIIHDHGGEINVFSRVGEGTQIKITLPINPNSSEDDQSGNLSAMIL